MSDAVAWAYPPGLPDGRGSVATVGTFDGLHRGHWTVLETIRDRAEATGRRSVVVTFDPHPLKVIRPAQAPRLLTTVDEKKAILAQSGVECAVFLSFTEALSRYGPRRFVEEILLGRLGVEELVIGYDHGFGRDRAGGADSLEAMGRELGFRVDVVSPVQTGEGAISSSRIRRLLQEGAVADAAMCLGRAYALEGEVVRGDGRGRGLGFPTANLSIGDDDKLVPGEGIYAVRCGLGAETRVGALHLGPRPTFPGATPSVEVHVLDFDRDVYGERMRIEFVERVRGIEPFTTVEALVERIGEDVDEVRRIVSETPAMDEPPQFA